MYNKRKICPVKFRLTMDFARLLGYYLAEGSAPRHISLVIAKHEDDLLEEIKRSLVPNVYRQMSMWRIRELLMKSLSALEHWADYLRDGLEKMPKQREYPNSSFLLLMNSN